MFACRQQRFAGWRTAGGRSLDQTMDKYTESFYPESFFGGFTQADGTVAFYSRVNALIEPSFVLVDFGCGRGQHAEDEVSTRRRLQCFKGRVAKVIGLDVDSAGQTNPTIDEFQIGRASCRERGPIS